MAITERYSRAVHASTLKPNSHKGDEGSATTNVDVLGGYGLADKHLSSGWRTTGRNGEGYNIKPAPLAVPLERLLAGDGRAAHEIVRILADMAFEHSWVERVRISHPKCEDMARACLAWYRNGRCNPCGGHGKILIEESKALSNRDCPHCYDPRSQSSTGKIPFERNFRQEWQSLARWLVSEMARETGKAGPAAMAALAPRLEL